MINFGAIIAFAIVAFEIASALKSLSDKRNFAGKLKKTYKHKSSLKKFGYILLLITPLYAYGLYASMDDNMVVGFMMVVFSILFFIRTRKDIEIYDNGVSFFGKFTKWDTIDSVRLGKKDTVILISKLKKVRVVEIDNVVDKDQVVKTIENNIGKLK
jgi:hypothetical protein